VGAGSEQADDARLEDCLAVTDKEVQELSHLTGLEDLNLNYCINVSSEGLRAVSGLTGLDTLCLNNCPGVTDEGLRAISNLTALSLLYLRVTAAPPPSCAGSVVHVAALRASEGLCHSARAEHTQPPLLAVGRCLAGCQCHRVHS
jgi:hypothetical protein